jgi:hypothetical protein
MSNNEGVHVVAIHGVGNRRLGEIVKAIAVGLSHTAPVQLTMEWRFSKGERYQSAELKGHPFVKCITEVNWDDISHPAGWNPLQLLGHVLANLIAMLRLATKPLITGGRAPLFANVYGALFIYMLLWCVYPPIVVIGGYAASQLVQTVWLLGVPFALALITSFLVRYDKRFRAGYLWVIAILIAGSLIELSRKALSIMLIVTSTCYAVIQGLSGIALLFAVLEAWMKSRTLRREERLSRLALLYLPFAIISGVGALVWTLVLLIARYALGESDLAVWSKSFLVSLPYDLAFVETVLGSAVALCAILLTLPAYALIKDDRSGAKFHTSFLFVLGVIPWILGFVGLLNAAQTVEFYRGGQCAPFKNWIAAPLADLLGSGSVSTACPKVMAVYAWSALRLAPLLSWLVGPLRVFVDTLGDVLLYLDDKGHLGGSTVKELCQTRFRKALQWAISTNPDGGVLVLAHSQGTVISADVLAKMPANNAFFVTLGSPISSLYWRLVGKEAVASPSSNAWLNIYRTGDYISGGEGIKGEWTPLLHVTDKCLGAGRHAGYFEDPLVWKTILDWLSGRTPSRSSLEALRN